MLRLLILTIALVAGGAAAWLSIRYVSQEPEIVEIRVEVPMEDVLVLAEDLPRGSVVVETNLRWQPLPLEAVPAGATTRAAAPDAVAAMAGRVARGDLLAGDALREGSLIDGGAGLMSLVLEPGRRAVGLRISDEKIAGGFILPGDKVDVIHTLVRDSDGDGVATGISRTILTNVRVLAIGQIAARSGAKNATTGDIADPMSDVTARGETATVEVTPLQAEILTAAQSSGSLSLSLRAVSDFGDTGIGADIPAEAESPSPAAEAAPAARMVRVIGGGQEVVFTLGAAPEEAVN